MTGDDAVRQPQINANHVGGDRQGCGGFLHQKTDMVTASGVTAHRDTARRAGKATTPPDVERVFVFGEPELTLAPAKTISHVSRGLLALFFLKGGIPRLTFEKITKRPIQVPQRLLQTNIGDFGQKCRVRLFLEGSERFGGGVVAHALLTLKPSIGALAQEVVVNVAHTAKRPGKLVGLLGRGIKPITIGAVYGGHAFNLSR